MNNDFNLIISSWPSAGGSTAARILTLALNKNYIYAGGVLKAWVKAMGYDPTSNEINTWSEKYHDHWDYVWESYIKEKVKNSTNTVFEGKTAGFMLKDTPNIFKIYIIASLEARKARSKSDLRIEEIQKRDKFLSQKWEKSFGFKMFDMKTLKAKYNYILDTTDLKIEEVPVVILEKLKSESIIGQDLTVMKTKLAEIFAEYKANSNYLMQEIERRGLSFGTRDIFREIAGSYPDLIKDIPDEMKIVF